MTAFHVYLYGADKGPLLIGFEAAAEQLMKLDRLYFEWDGSFVWKPSEDQEVFGMIYDAAGQVQYMELRGDCSLSSWRFLLKSLGSGCNQIDNCVMRLPGRQLQDLQEFETSFSQSQGL